MGLDSFVFRIHKPKPVEDRIYREAELKDMSVWSFCKESADMDLVDDLLPYCREIRVNVSCIDLEKIRKEYYLSDNAYIFARFSDGSARIVDTDTERPFNEVFSVGEINEQYTVEKIAAYCIFECEEVAYWRKNYDVQNFFYEHVDDVDNTGYYLLDSDVLEEFNDSGDESWGKLPVEEPTVNEALFYHEWY